MARRKRKQTIANVFSTATTFPFPRQVNHIVCGNCKTYIYVEDRVWQRAKEHLEELYTVTCPTCNLVNIVDFTVTSEW